MTKKEDIETLVVPAGIGDNLWVLQTLDPDRKYDFEICAGKPPRGKQIFDLVPSMVNSVKYTDKKYPQECTYQVNKHLEEGNHISKFRNNGFVNWNLPFDIPMCQKRRAHELVKNIDLVRKPIIGIYASSIKANKTLSGWSAQNWYNLMDLLKEYYDNDISFALIGAEYDDLLDKSKFDVICMDEPLGTTIQFLDYCYTVIAFQSGIPILSSYLGIDTLMMFADKLHDMKDTFCRDKSNWQAMSFESPETIFQKLIEREWL